jgi:hypothetical protein
MEDEEKDVSLTGKAAAGEISRGASRCNLSRSWWSKFFVTAKRATWRPSDSVTLGCY